MFGYERCRMAIESARFEKPVVLESMTIRFDPWKLESIRDIYGYELYRKVMDDINKEEGV